MCGALPALYVYIHRDMYRDTHGSSPQLLKTVAIEALLLERAESEG